ncbi:hypothetical protein SAMN06297251_102143 [Fulvimarina manganoxydans]|uniref:DUF4376 domain-containing protein n=1 Tax=Fulvimarina manganoxydans TaxID=937218 RepID=A0A1W1Z3Y6_9HYPH|nr:DUF4376 domain-containing protein [Fulvimarina manganoxydans]SMC43197.1 hypothetical protein SAMN06297251_102143 [Fulvimarina manganoxydans]
MTATAIVRKDDGLVLYLFDGSPDLTIDERGLHGPVRALDIRPETHEAIEVEDVPSPWVGGAYAWDGSDWAVVNQAILDAIELRRSEEAGALLTKRLATLAEYRWRREEAGIAWVRPSDSRVFGIATDRESQAKMQAERSAARDGLRTDGAGWKCLDAATGRIVWEPMANADVEAFAADAWAYVSACFAREGALGAALYAAAADDGRTADERISAIEAVDLEVGWP